MPSKLSSDPDAGSKRRKRNEGESAEQSEKSMPGDSMTEEGRQSVEHKGRERRNGYQKISTAAYYQTERRGFNGFGEVHDWLKAKTEIDGAPGIEGTSYGGSEPDR